jgi:hypothetical protein
MLTNDMMKVDMKKRHDYWTLEVLYDWYNKVMADYKYTRYESTFKNLNGTIGGWDMSPLMPSTRHQTNKQMLNTVTTTDVSNDNNVHFN